jgi:hypothetical protein
MFAWMDAGGGILRSIRLPMIHLGRASLIDKIVAKA